MVLLVMAIGATSAQASPAHGSPFATRINPGPIALSCARTGPATGRVRVDAEVAYADLKQKVESRPGKERGQGAARLVLLTSRGKVLAKARDRDRLRFGFKGNHVYDGQEAVLSKRASHRVLRYAHGQGGCARVPKRDRRVKVVIRAREALTAPGAKQATVRHARLAGGSRVATLRRASGTACPPYACFEKAAEILAWSEKDVRPFDRASVPIAPRVTPPGPRMLVGLDNGPWAYWSDFDLNAQGSSRTGNVYNFSHWQYVDSLYYYAHRLLAVPPTVWVNAAHRNGVSVLGIMTGDCTGCGKEMNELFRNSGPAAVDRLYQLAATYGFDGWLIDVEGESEYSPQLLAAMKSLRGRKLPDGRPVQVVTYEAFKTSLESELLEPFKAAGEWQSDYDHGATSTSPEETYKFLSKEHLSERRYDTYWATDVYRPYGQYPPSACNGQSSAVWLWNGLACNRISMLFENQGSARAGTEPPGFYQSMALYAPGWTAFAGRNSTTEPPPPRNVFQAADERLWSGTGGYRISGEGCRLATPTQNSVSSLVSPRSPLTSVPFVTNFDTGEGEGFAVQGRTAGRSWNLLAAQDALPSEICGEGSELQAAIDYGGSFEGGSSLLVSGATYPNTRRIYLYEAAAKLPAKPAFVLRYLSSGQGPPPLVTVWIDGKGPIDLPPAVRVNEGTWTYTRAELPSTVAPGTLTRLGISFSTPSPVTVDTRIGELGVVDLSSYAPPAPIRPTVEPGQLSWSDPAAATTKYYNVWAVPAGGSCSGFVGRSLLPRYDLVRPLFAIPGPSPQFTIQPVNTAGLAARISPSPC
jgi:endo-beta-N-acetylglucosaminidase D